MGRRLSRKLAIACLLGSVGLTTACPPPWFWHHERHEERHDRRGERHDDRHDRRGERHDDHHERHDDRGERHH
jgi:hypothetical protein